MGTEVQSSLLFETTEELYERVFREFKPRSLCPQITVKYKRFANANSFIRLVPPDAVQQQGRLEVKISDALESAPAPIQEALARILLGKLLRREVPSYWSQRYRLYLNRADVRGELHRLRLERGRKHLSGPEGTHHNLEPLFDDLNRRFFNGELARLTLSWSRGRSRSMLGHYDPSHHVIVISRILDTGAQPNLALEYVLYHEMLHLKHPVEHNGARRRVHTPAFRAEEKLFPDLKLAKKLLKEL